MPIDLSQNIDRFEAGDLRMFNYVDQASVPSTVAFSVYGLDNQPVAAPTVTISGGDITQGMFFAFVQLPDSRGFYSYEWKAYGSGTAQSSLYVTVRGTFEVAKTEARSWFSYGNKNNVMRVARQLIGRGDLTEYDVEPHMLAAYSYINGRLNGVSAVPLTPTPPYIAQGEEVLSIYTLYGSFGTTEKGEIPPAFEKLRDDFVAYLDAVVKGEAQLDGVPSLAGTVTQFTGGVAGGKPTFGRRPVEEQKVDPNVMAFERDDDKGL